MSTIAGGIILAACILTFSPLLISLIAVMFVGVFRLAVILTIPAIVISSVVFGGYYAKENLINGWGLALLVVLAAVSLVYFYFQSVWDFGNLQTAISYYRLLFRRAPDLAAEQSKQEEIYRFRDYRSSIRARRKADIERQKAQERLKKLHDARDKIAKSLSKFTASTDFRIETDDAQHRLELFFEGVKVGSVVESGYSYQLLNDSEMQNSNAQPRAPDQIAKDIKTMLRQRVKQMKTAPAFR